MIIQSIITFQTTRWMLLQRLLGVITDWKLCGREHGGILVVIERSGSILSETRSTGTMVEFKKPGRPEKGNTELSISSSLPLSHGLHICRPPLAIFTLQLAFFKATPYAKDSTMCDIKYCVHIQYCLDMNDFVCMC